MRKVLMADLCLGDIVQVFGNVDGYKDSTVCGIAANGDITLFRPYTHTSQMAFGDGQEGLAIIPYVGFERWTMAFDAKREVTLIHKQNPPIK